jgi:hypothetical protein
MARTRGGILVTKDSKYKDDAKLRFGSGAMPTNFSLSDAHLVFDGTDLWLTESGDAAIAFKLGPRMRPTFFNNLSERLELKWVAGQRGKPGINGDIASATESVREIADPDFEVLGTNGTSALSTFNAEGGLTFTTDTGANDQMILVPHLDASQSAWARWTWGTDREVQWECDIELGATIAAAIVWAGLKLTNTSTTATDANQAFFRYQNGVNDGEWEAVSSIAGTDDEHDSGVVAVASTRYHLKIVIAADRVARFYINGDLVETSAALTDAIDLIPYVGVQTTTTAAKAITIYGQQISRLAGA